MNVDLKSALAGLLAFACTSLSVAARASADVTTELGGAAAFDYALRFYNPAEKPVDKTTAANGASADEIWDGVVRGGWPDTLSAFSARFRPEKSYVTLYKKFPRWPIDMRSPDRFKRSMSARELTGKSSIGHMSIGWSCVVAGDSGRAERSEGFAAQTGEDSGQSTEMLNTGWGVNAIIATFTDGHIQNAKQIQRYFSKEYVGYIQDQKEPVPFFALVVEVPLSDCEAVRDFVNRYVWHPSTPWKNFGLIPDPLKFEGAGCGSFAVAALSEAQTLTALTNAYWRTLPIPEKLFGLRSRIFLPNHAVPFSYAKTASEENSIGKYQLVLKNWDSGRAALNLRLVDPELTIFSFRKFAEIAAREAGRTTLTSYQIEHLGRTKRVYNFPGGGGSESYLDDKDVGYQEIKEDFDPHFADVASSVERWWSTHQATSSLHVVSIPFGVGIMIEGQRPNGR